MDLLNLNLNSLIVLLNILHGSIVTNLTINNYVTKQGIGQVILWVNLLDINTLSIARVQVLFHS